MIAIDLERYTDDLVAEAPPLSDEQRSSLLRALSRGDR